jgi:methyl-accepting chemotaxis protein
MILILAIPVYDDNNNITDVLAMGILASWLSDQIDDIVVGKTGECYILDNLGSTTIEKIGTAIQAVGVNAGTMEDVGAELVSNMKP